jgi:hypothetical protein
MITDNPTLESVWAMIHETQRQMQESKAETDRFMKDLAEKQAKSKAETDRI